MAGTVESSIVLNAVDNTKSALNSVQSNLEKLVHKATEVSNGFSKIWTEWMSWFQLQTTKALNEVNRLTKYLSECTEWTQEYTIVQNRLNSAREKYNQLFEESDERTRQDIQAQLDEYNALQQVNQAQEQHTSILQKAGQFISEHTQKLFSHKENIMSNKEAMQYWEEQIKRVENELAQAEQQLATMDKQVWTSSDELQRQREYVRELEQQLKEYKKELKDTTANMSPFQLALQKLGKNIKSLFLLHAAKWVLDGMRKAFKWAVNEMIEWWLKLEQVAGNFDHLAEVGWMDAIKLRNALREASHNMVSDVDLMQSTSKAMLLWVGWNIENLANLMKIAEVRGAQMGQSTTKSFDDVVLWIWRLSPKILDNLWIIVSLTDAYEIYAEKVWKSTDELTKQEQQIALTEEVLRQSQQQLLDWENKNLSVQEKLTQITTKIKNALHTVWAQFMSWLTPVVDKINEIATASLVMADDVTANMRAVSNKVPKMIATAIEEIWETVKVVAEDIIDIVWEVVWTFIDLLNEAWKGFDIFMNWIGVDTEDSLNWIAGDWTDLFYFLRLWFATVFTIAKWTLVWIKWVFKALWNNVSTIAGYLSGNFTNAWNSIKYGAINMAQSALDSIIGMANGIAEKWQDLKFELWLSDTMWKKNTFGTIDLYWLLWINKNDLNQYKWTWEQFTQDLAEPRKETRDEIWDTMEEWYKKIEDIYVNRVGQLEKRKYEVEKKNSPRQTLPPIENEDLWGWGWSWGSKKSETEKMSEEMKQLIKDMDDYAKETSKIKEKNMDNIVASMEECVKEAEKLAKEVSKLQDELDKLGWEERQDIAEQYVKAEEQLKDLEEQYTNIKEAVEDLWEAYIKNDMGREEKRWDKIDRKTLREYIDLQEQLKSAYEWLNDEWVKLLDEQIKKQKEYNELNDIEKIKYDYAEKRKAIEEDIAEKQALIEKELEEYKRLSDEKIAYEKEWLNYMQWSATKQMEWQQKLINQAERLLELRREAWLASGWNTWHRAGWWVVYWWESYIVWEHWPELFTPNVSWKITPNNQITNNNWIEVNITGVSVRNEWDINALADEIVRRIKLEKNFWIS